MRFAPPDRAVATPWEREPFAALEVAGAVGHAHRVAGCPFSAAGFAKFECMRDLCGVGAGVKGERPCRSMGPAARGVPLRMSTTLGAGRCPERPLRRFAWRGRPWCVSQRHGSPACAVTPNNEAAATPLPNLKARPPDPGRAAGSCCLRALEHALRRYPSCSRRAGGAAGAVPGPVTLLLENRSPADFRAACRRTPRPLGLRRARGCRRSCTAPPARSSSRLMQRMPRTPVPRSARCAPTLAEVPSPCATGPTLCSDGGPRWPGTPSTVFDLRAVIFFFFFYEP